MMNDNTNNTKSVPALCSQCGGQIEVNPSQEKAVCKYCGTSFSVEKAIQNYNVQNAKIEHVESMNINKRGAVKSILAFIEGQQDKKQQKIDEEKRRQEEEKRKQEEQRKKIINQLFNKQYRKRNLGIIGIFFVIILILSFIGGPSKGQDNIVKINMPASSSDFEGKNYQDVITKLQDAGFTNIKTAILDDLVTGWLTKDGEVKQVKVDSETSFSPSSSYPKDVPIVVTYHTFPEKESEKNVKDDVKTKETISTVETQAETKKEVPEKLVEEDYSVINKLIYNDLLQAKGWALGTLDGDGNPTKNGTPSPSFTFSLYIENATYLGDKLQISVFPKFEQLSDEDKTNIANTVQNMVNVHTNNIPYSTIRLNGDVTGHSKATNTKAFKWD